MRMALFKMMKKHRFLVSVFPLNLPIELLSGQEECNEYLQKVWTRRVLSLGKLKPVENPLLIIYIHTCHMYIYIYISICKYIYI